VLYEKQLFHFHEGILHPRALRRFLMKDFLTTGDIARMCDIPYFAALYWVKEGKIKSQRTPGGHYRIKRTDFVAFLDEYNYPVPPKLRVFRKKRILIVDDEPEKIKRMLALSNGVYETCYAKNGFFAAWEIMEFSPDIVILDTNLMDANCIEVIKSIKTNPETRTIRILIKTNDKENMIGFLQAGADDCLQKSSNVKELQKRVLSLLEV